MIENSPMNVVFVIEVLAVRVSGELNSCRDGVVTGQCVVWTRAKRGDAGTA